VKLPATAELLIRVIGYNAAIVMMEPGHYGGKNYAVPKGELGRGEQTFAVLAEVIGMEAAKRLCGHFGGDCIYVPLLDKLHRAERDRGIVAAYNSGTSVWQLSSDNAMSERQIRNILKKTDMDESSMSDGPQRSLF
jgi:Mor family transcriptional regulator